MLLLSGLDTDFIAIDPTLQSDRETTFGDPLTVTLDHRPGIVPGAANLRGNLQSQEVQARGRNPGDPGHPPLVMAGDDGVGQIVEALQTTPALIALTIWLDFNRRA